MPSNGAIRVPAAGPDDAYCTLFSRAPGFGELAEAELGALSAGEVVEPGVFLSRAPIPWAETAFGTAGGRQLAAARDLDSLRAQMVALDLRAPTFGIKVRRLPRDVKGSQVAKRLIADHIDGDVDFAAPALSLFLVVSTWGFRLFVEGPPGDGRWRASNHKPHNLPIALSAPLARALINLSAVPGESLLDPFCGSGTIPLVAAFAGLRAYGSDISAAWVERAGANIAHFGQRVTLRCCDARDADQPADCVVTNPPYGIFCHLGEGALDAILRNLRRLAPRLTLVSSERLEATLERCGYTLSRVISVEPERFQRYIYLARAR